jgi:mannan endo-1,4-beta-mannosidase
VDVIASYLSQLQDAHVPVLWRPYHEMNGVWFWWCDQKGENGFKKLWIMMYDYMVNHHHLNNLIWVWDTNAPRSNPGDEAFAYSDFWPGAAYVDVLAADIYHKKADQGADDQKNYEDLVMLAAGQAGRDGRGRGASRARSSWPASQNGRGSCPGRRSAPWRGTTRQSSGRSTPIRGR